MNKSLLAVIVITLPFFAGNALAQRTPVPIVNYDNVKIMTGSGKSLTAEQVKAAIVSGAGAGRRIWVVTQAPGSEEIEATYQVRTHTIVVNIRYSATDYSVRYARSIDMKYGLQDNVPVIHPFYNNWVAELMESIRAELKKL